ncbi:MAG: zinc-dependent alcohol dehydrogenase family protein [Caldilineaceae bacterium]|nr:zinc-dependent alcohol dehydrogenase family protein [Caldilineaceae bacterium]
MRAIVFPAPETIALETVPDPAPARDEVVVQVDACGICGTDLHIYRNEYMSDFPLIPGHEFGGTVVEIGRDVTDVAVGDRVAVDPNLYCGRCDFCRNEQANHCANWQGIGITRSGGFAEYVAAPARACYHLPAALDATQVAFIEPLACVVHALRRFPVHPADRTLILGAGPMGLLLVQALRHSGASLLAVTERQPARLALAQELGATVAVPADADQKERLEELSPRGFDVVIDATGLPRVIESAFDYLAPRGRYLQFGVTPMNAEIRLRPYDLFHKDWTIVGSFALCYTFQPAIDWLANGVIDVSRLVSHRYPLEEFETGFQAFARGDTLKVHITRDPAG